jgi:hypothetical protein
MSNVFEIDKKDNIKYNILFNQEFDDEKIGIYYNIDNRWNYLDKNKNLENIDKKVKIALFKDSIKPILKNSNLNENQEFSKDLTLIFDIEEKESGIDKNKTKFYINKRVLNDVKFIDNRAVVKNSLNLKSGSYNLKIELFDKAGNYNIIDNIKFSINDEFLLKSFTLFPNPLRDDFVNLRYFIKGKDATKIEIFLYDIKGRVVLKKILEDDIYLNSSMFNIYKFYFDDKNISNGVYFLKFIVYNNIDNKKIEMIKKVVILK